jgi:hypothetical protein
MVGATGVDEGTGEVASHHSDHSPTIGSIAAALAKAQGQMTGASKDAVNPHFQRKYADLASCIEAAREALSKNELAVVQMTDSGPDGVGIISFLLHSSGEWFRSRLWMPLSQPTPQAIGSAITYGRRYGFCALVGVAPEDDDDANSAQGAQAAHSAAPARARGGDAPHVKPPPRRTEAQAAKDMHELLRKAPSREALDRVWQTIEGMPFTAPMQSELRLTYEREGARVGAAA